MSQDPESMELDSPKPDRNMDKEEKDHEDDQVDQLPDPPQEIGQLFRRLNAALKRRLPQHFSKNKEERQDLQRRWQKLFAAIARFHLDECSKPEEIAQFDHSYEIKDKVEHKYEVVPMLVDKAGESSKCTVCMGPFCGPITLGDQCTVCAPCLADLIEEVIALGPNNGFFWFGCPNCGTHYDFDDLYPLWEMRVNETLCNIMTRLTPQWERDVEMASAQLDQEKYLIDMNEQAIEKRLRYRKQLIAFQIRQERATQMRSVGHLHHMNQVSVHVCTNPKKVRLKQEKNYIYMSFARTLSSTLGTMCCFTFSIPRGTKKSDPGMETK